MRRRSTKHKYILLICLLSIICWPATGQLSLKSPQICHDDNGFLKCYFDGEYRLYFANGNFTNLLSDDSAIKYSDSEKTLSFYSMPLKETVQVKLLQHSILITKEGQKKEITSFPSVPITLHGFYMGTYSDDNVGRGLAFWAAGKKWVQIEVWPFKESWSWKIMVRDSTEKLLLDYNSYKENRIESIMLMDDSLGYAMSVSMTFKSLRKLWWLRAFPTDAKKNTSIPYWYYYNTNGKLDKKRTASDIKICNCE
jgi:hypothetical protein